MKKITELMVDEKPKGRDRTIQSASALGVLISSYDSGHSKDGGFLACLLWQPLGGGWSFFTMSSGNSRDDEQQDG